MEFFEWAVPAIFLSYTPTFFLCLFWVYRFHSYGDVNITDDGLQILTCSRYSWPLSSSGFLACQTYCDHLQAPYHFCGLKNNVRLIDQLII